MRSLLWLAVLLAGFGLMLFSYWHFQRIADPNPWTEAFMYVGKGKPAGDVSQLPCEAAQVRHLPPGKIWSEILREVEQADPRAAAQLKFALREKVVRLPGFREDFTPEMLASGRLPRPGTDEILAGGETAHRGALDAWGTHFTVVGVLDRSVALLGRAYVVPGDAVSKAPFEDRSDEVYSAYILRMDRREALRLEMRKRLAAAFPPRQFRVEAGIVRVGPGSYGLYLAGMALLFLGGSALFMRVYEGLARVIPVAWLRAPFEAARDGKALLGGLHALLFGTIILLSAVAYLVPPFQILPLMAVNQTMSEGSGPLGVAAQAYMSGSIPRAAVVTLIINFFLGSLAYITAPSVVIPGVGVWLTWLRAVLIGFLMAPTMLQLSTIMLPHSFTVLVEMEAYVLAAFFAALIPVYLFDTSKGPGVWRRYGRALLLNLKAYAVILALLTIAAIYEATEVILMMR